MAQSTNGDSASVASAATRLHGLLTPDECVLTLIDYQPQMFFGTASVDRLTVVNNATVLAKAAKLFNVPVVLTTVAAEIFSGQMIPELQEVFHDQQTIDRTTMNSWEDENFKQAIEKTGRKKVVLAGLWTVVCVRFPTVQMIRDGYEVYVPFDACGDISQEAQSRRNNSPNT